ncbi:TPA: hypothetical protein TUI13_001804 [Streptococcus equi subsp. zooepidemicus]|uniref:hypothetical protein n=1 Tax=Streptococcus equi TaxID=1336 RepID=UPI001E292E6D|nr:hypothetical protein [Streptococcus equi]MCD3372168.1 hypothetical protein [Streptococcus equi subsp. zooepidemicus]HEL0145504.1 hypothetical protein [Streptococcus equi subsp. zooepidemicus]HEL0175510.1 hypothetical protein [Streptococcus equi subsp. zooepidemicus]HEL0189652.1 hypothetical protein [Streptococcus equi subsp. zooepidemicus]HEL0215601.1 hypothetical protein [Streptococcus equi subsp. zooepidemicus]
MIREQDYNKIANDVYKVDSGKERDPIQEGYPVANGKYRVLKTKYTLNNGMQAMAVAPIKGGEVDKSHIIIVYAGINHLTAT